MHDILHTCTVYEKKPSSVENKRKLARLITQSREYRDILEGVGKNIYIYPYTVSTYC